MPGCRSAYKTSHFMKLKSLLLFTGLLMFTSLRTWATDTEPDNNAYTGADTITQNDTLSGALDAGSDANDWYHFTTTDDGTITLTLDHDGYYMYLKLYDSDGTTQLGSTGSGYVGDIITVSVGGLQAGTYYLRVERYGSSPGNYEVSYDVTTDGIMNDAEPNNTSATAMAIAENGNAEGHINFRGNGAVYDTYDWYQVITSSDGTLSATLVHNGYFAYVQLFDNDGTTALGGEASGYVGDSITASFGGLAAGTYYIRVRGYGSNNAGYTLTNTVITDGITNDVEPNDDASTAVVMAENGSADGHINFRKNGGSYDVYDWYEVTTTSDGTISVTLDHNGYYAYVRLFDSDGVTGIGSEGAGYVGDLITVDNAGLAAGTYYIRVRGYSDDAAGYTLTNTVITDGIANDVEVNNTPAEAQSMMTNSSTDGHINYRLNGGSRDTYDYYAVTISNPGDLTVTLDHNAYFAYLVLYDTDGTTALTSEVGGYAVDILTVSAADLTPGTYYIRVRGYSTDAGGYTLTNNYCPDEITITAEGETTFCEGESVTLSTDDHHLSYLWSDGSTTETNVVTLSGDYSLTIDNGSGCVRTSNTINAESTPLPVAIIEADGPLTFCDGDDVTLSVDAIPDSYLWSDGSTGATLTVSETGDYSVQLFKNGCSAISDPVHVTVNANPTATISADGPIEFCDGGSVTLTASAATSYLWSDGSTGASVLVDGSGDYSVTVTDANGCTDMSETTSVIENANPVAGISADGPTTFCTGGSVNLTATGGTSYLWNTGETSATINVTTSGIYSATVYNAEGCSDVTDAISVSADPCGDVTITADGPTEFCDGGSVMLTSSEPTGNVWSTGETTQSITVSTSGDYSCDNGVNTSNTITVTVNANPTATISADGPTEFCDGGSVTLTSSAASSYLWSDGSTGSSVLADASGDYSVTITDMNGCSATSATTSVTENANPTATISADGPTEFCSGSVNLSVDGSYDSYFWSTGETTSSINVSSAGSYSCTVTNASGCSGVSNSIEVTTGTAPTISISSLDGNIICYGGTIELVAVASAGNLQWYNKDVELVGETGTSLFVTEPGRYYCVATDGGCSTTSNTIKIKSANKVAITPSGTNYICETGLTISVPYMGSATYQWYKGSTLISGATSNTYEATVAGNYKCYIMIDGCTRVSEVCKVVVSCGEKSTLLSETDLNAYPNPAMNKFTLEYSTAISGDVIITISDITGAVVNSEIHSLSAGINTFDFSSDLLPSGVYLISATAQDGQTEQLKLVIEK